MRILIVEDDKAIAMGLEYSLNAEGYQTVHCAGYTPALAVIAAENFDLYLLDISLPDGSGYDLCKEIKSRVHAPVIFLTALDEEVNVVMGLDLGADDYIAKPFRIRELLSRIKSALRPYSQADALPPGDIHLGSVTIHPAQARVTRGGEMIYLTAMEYRLLLTLAANRGQVMSRGQLLEHIWDVDGEFVSDNTLSVYIRRLREKLEDDPKNPRWISTVRSMGYRLEPEDD